MSNCLPDAQVGTRTYRISPPSSAADALPEEDRPRFSERDVAHLVRTAENRVRAEAELAFEARVEAFDGECERVLRALVGAADDLRREAATMAREAAQATARLSCVVARRLLRAELSRPERTIAPLIEEILPRLGSLDKIVIRLSVRDYQALSGQKWLEIGRERGIRFLGEDTIETGGCRVETERGTWDANLDSQLDRIQAELEEALAPGGSSDGMKDAA